MALYDDRYVSLCTQELDKGKMNEDDIDARLKWVGFFHRRKITYGRFFMRTKLPNGIQTSAQARRVEKHITKAQCNAAGMHELAVLCCRQNFYVKMHCLVHIVAMHPGILFSRCAAWLTLWPCIPMMAALTSPHARTGRSAA
jgi:hypothetical protein